MDMAIIRAAQFFKVNGKMINQYIKLKKYKMLLVNSKSRMRIIKKYRHNKINKY